MWLVTLNTNNLAFTLMLVLSICITQTNLIYPVQFLECLLIQIIDLTWMNEPQTHVYYCQADQKLVQILNLSTMVMYHFYSPALTVLSNFLQEEKYTHSS